jgi:hypothetical protein
MSGLGLLLALISVTPPALAGGSELPAHLLPTVLPEPLALQPVPRPTNCTPAVLVGAATMIVSAAIFARGFIDDDKPLKTAGAVGETLGAAVLIFGVSRPTCL